MPRKRIISAMVACAAAAASILVTTAPAQADDGIWISVQTPAGSSGKKVLDIRGYSTEDRGQATLSDHRTSGEVRNQRWIVEEVGNTNGHRLIRLRNVLSKKCLDKSEDVPNANGNAVYQYGCSSASNQKWEVLGSSGHVQLKNVAGGRCLDVKGPDFTNGAILHVWDCYSTWSQRWNVF
ncbi:RICIN domain-containing protein [Nonomuraea sp. NPDC050691]|uniref:RICIN domain-containing protein n=1 Tax=Nonomuraea sp. NPDC050691 TaxID=3155661 RepID=UPI00340A3547